MITPLSALRILWLAWVVVWALASWWTARTVARQSLGSRLGHGIFLGMGAAFLFGRLVRSGWVTGPLFPPSPWTAWAGVALCAAGLGFAIWARAHIGRFWSGTVTL